MKEEDIINKIIEIEAQVYDRINKQPQLLAQLKDLYLSLGYHLTDEQKSEVLAKRRANQMEQSGLYRDNQMNKNMSNED